MIIFAKNFTGMSDSLNIAFLFDLDGVLIDSEQEYTRIWHTIEREFPTGVENFTLKIKGTTLENILDTYFKINRDRVEERLYHLEGEMHYNYAKGAPELLNYLHERNIPCVMVTSSNQVKLDHLWAQLPELRQYFSSIIDGDMVTRSKPDPEGYLSGARAVGLHPTHCVVVEDSLQGVKAGRAADAYVIGVAGTLPAVTLQPFCDQVVNSLDEINFTLISQAML